MKIEQKEWLKVEEVARKLNTSAAQVRSAIKRQKLQAFRDGNVIRISQEQLQNYIESCTR